MTHGRLIEYEAQQGEALRREVTYPAAARLATQTRPATTPAVTRRQPLRAWFVRRLNRSTA